jgi:hypothetical protein
MLVARRRGNSTIDGAYIVDRARGNSQLERADKPMNTDRLAPKFLICSSWALPIYAHDSNAQPDNTGVNKPDRKPGAMTADQQKDE